MHDGKEPLLDHGGDFFRVHDQLFGQKEVPHGAGDPGAQRFAHVFFPQAEGFVGETVVDHVESAICPILFYDDPGGLLGFIRHCKRSKVIGDVLNL